MSDWIAVGRAMTRPLKAIIAHHVVVTGAGRIVLEGDGVLPELALQTRFDDLAHFQGLRLDREIRAVFVVEPNEAQLLANMRSRRRGFDERKVTSDARYRTLSVALAPERSGRRGSKPGISR